MVASIEWAFDSIYCFQRQRHLSLFRIFHEPIYMISFNFIECRQFHSRIIAFYKISHMSLRITHLSVNAYRDVRRMKLEFRFDINV